MIAMALEDGDVAEVPLGSVKEEVHQADAMSLMDHWIGNQNWTRAQSGNLTFWKCQKLIVFWG